MSDDADKEVIVKLKAELEAARKQTWQAQVTIKRLHAELEQAAERQRDGYVEGLRRGLDATTPLICPLDNHTLGCRCECRNCTKWQQAYAILAQAEVKK
jgi:hypothetical protein